MISEALWCVEDESTGMPVAQGTAPTADEASREATHYALQYRQDGPVRWWVLQGRKTIVNGRFAGVSVEMRATGGGGLTFELSGRTRSAAVKGWAAEGRSMDLNELALAMHNLLEQVEKDRKTTPTGAYSYLAEVLQMAAEERGAFEAYDGSE